jgi:hypothetical protein
LVFSGDKTTNSRFYPVLKWIRDGKGKIILGGTKYQKEMRACGILGLLVEFERQGRVVHLADAVVDKVCKSLKVKVPDNDFDDEHIIAIAVLSKCRVICTDDQRAIKYKKMKNLYEKGTRPPKIYRNTRHSRLCCEENIVSSCL